MTATLEPNLLEAGPRIEAQQEDEFSSRWYPHPETSDPYLSVTWVTGAAQSKPWLAPWAAKTAASYAVDFVHHWMATNRDHGRDAAVKEITRIAAANRDLKAEIGRYEHDVIEALFLDAPLPGIPEHLDGQVVEWDGDLIVIGQEWLDQLAHGFLNFVADFDVKGVAAECTVASDEHEAAGTIDGIVRLRGFDGLVGMDTKTGAKLGPEILAQLGAYDAFPHLWLGLGQIVRKPPISRWVVLHLRDSYARGYKVLAVKPEELAAGWEWWQQCRRQIEIGETVPKRFGHALYPPLPDGSQPPPMIEDLTSYAGAWRAVRPLKAHGVLYLHELAELHRADVKALDGVGPKTLTLLADVLAEFGLAFRGEPLPERKVA